MAGIFFAASPAGAQIARPQLGYVLDSGGALRPVFGIAASASLGDPAFAGATSFACSSTLCLAKADAAVIAFVPGAPGNQSVAVSTPPVLSSSVTPCACPGPALIALVPVALDPATNGGGAWIYFQAGRQLARWQSGVLSVVDFAPGGEVLSLRATTDGFDYAIARESFGRKTRPEKMPRTKDVVWIEHYSASDGSVVVLNSFILDSLDGTGPVMLLDGGILLSSNDQVMLRRPNGQELAFPLDGANTFQAAGNGYVEIVAPGGMWILRTDAGSEQLSLLPGTPQ